MSKANLEIRPLKPSDGVEDFIEAVCSPKYTSRYYGDTPPHVAERFLEKHFNPGVGPEATNGGEIWIGLEDGVPVGYYTMLFKRWGTAKASTFIVKNEFQGRGLGRAFHAVIEGAYDERPGLRKLYHTAPVRETGHLRLDLDFGYRVEGHLKRHFIDECDELIMGRRPAAWASADGDAPRVPLTYKDGSSVTVEEIVGDASAEAGLLSQWISSTYDAADKAYAAHLLRPSPSRRIFLATSGGRTEGFLLYSRKRVKLGKATLVLDPQGPSRAAARALCQKAVDVADAEGARKLFTETPEMDGEMRNLLRGQGFQREGVLVSPYKEGCDLVLMSRFGR